MSGDEDYPPDGRAKATKAAIDARLTAFDRRKDELLRHLQNVCECPPKTKSFDPDTAWRHIRLYAWRYLREEADAEVRRKVPAADWVKRLHHLEEVLKDARTKLDEVRGPVFIEWCEAHGNPDFTDPIISVYENKFDELLPGLETAASRAAERMRPKPGRPHGSGVLQPEFVVALEYTYRNLTGKPGEADRGPFAQFITKFLAALGRKTPVGTIVKIIKRAKESDRWGRGMFVD
jgi:hypothetical protein